MHTKPPKILILSSAESEQNIGINDAFVASLQARLGDKAAPEWHNYHDIALHMGTGKLEFYILPEHRPVTNFAAVYFKSYFRYQEQAVAIAESLAEHNIPFVGQELKHYLPAYKLSQLARLSRGGLNIPETRYLSIENYPDHYGELTHDLGERFIFKAVDGSTGKDNYLVKSEAELRQIVSENGDRNFIAQRFIPNDSDLRVLVVGGVIRLVIERSRADDSTHLNNTSQGASARLLPLEGISEELKQISLHAAQLMGRDVAGVDVMLEKGTGKPYILEVNASPQIASGAFEAEKLDVYATYFAGLVGSHDR